MGMETHPFSVLKSAGWLLDVQGSPKPSRKPWPRTQPVTLRKGESSVVCSPQDQSLTFRICRRGECEDFVVPYSDTASVRRLAAL